MSQRSANLAAAVLFLALLSTWAAAADDAFKIVPGNALAWGAVNRSADADAKIQKLAAIVHAPAISVLDLVKQQVGAKGGIDDKGSAGFIVLPGKSDNEPGMVFFVAVTDYKAFLGNFEVSKAGDAISEVKIGSEQLVVAQREGYALIAAAKDRAALESAIQSKEAVAADVSDIGPWLAENDCSLVATTAGIKVFAKLASEQLEKMQKALSEAGANNAPGIDVAAIGPALDIYRQLIEGSSKEISRAALGLRVDKEGAIRLVVRAKLASGGEVAKSIAEISAPNNDLLEGIPGGSFVLAGGGISPGKMIERYMSFSTAILKSNQKMFGLNAEQAEKMQKLSTEDILSVRSMAMCMKIGKSGEPIYSNIYGTLHVDNAQEFLAKTLKKQEAMNELLKEAKDGAVKPMIITKIEIAGKPAVQQEMTFDFSKMPGTAGNPAMMDAMFGPDGKMVMYYVPVDEHTVFVGAGISKERMATAMNVIKDPKRSLAADADVAIVKAMLPTGAQGVVYVSIRGYATLVQRILFGTLRQDGLIPAEFNFPRFPKSPPVGIAVKALNAEVQIHVAVPADLLKACGEYVQALQGMMMNRAPQPPAP